MFSDRGQKIGSFSLINRELVRIRRKKFNLEISIKFHVDWYATWYILKNIKEWVERQKMKNNGVLEFFRFPMTFHNFLTSYRPSYFYIKKSDIKWGSNAMVKIDLTSYPLSITEAHDQHIVDRCQPIRNE